MSAPKIELGAPLRVSPLIKVSVYPRLLTFISDVTRWRLSSHRESFISSRQERIKSLKTSFSQFGRWSFLGLGVLYGAFHHNRLAKREVGIRAEEEKHKAIRDVKLAEEKKRAVEGIENCRDTSEVRNCDSNDLILYIFRCTTAEAKALAELSGPTKK